MQSLHTTASENDINDYGYSLYRRGRLEDAVNVFLINVERFPESLNVHDSYGEALAMTGDTAGAIDSYSRALGMATADSERERIEEILETLKHKGNR